MGDSKYLELAQLRPLATEGSDLNLIKYVSAHRQVS